MKNNCACKAAIWRPWQHVAHLLFSLILKLSLPVLLLDFVSVQKTQLSLDSREPGTEQVVGKEGDLANEIPSVISAALAIPCVGHWLRGR
jgi:hypothetical protein